MEEEEIKVDRSEKLYALFAPDHRDLLRYVCIYKRVSRLLLLLQSFIHHRKIMRLTITTALGFLFAASFAHAQGTQAPAGTSPLDALDNYCKMLGPAAKDPVALTTSFCNNLAAGNAATGGSGVPGGSIPGVKELCELVKKEPTQVEQAAGSVGNAAPIPEVAKGILDKAQNICKDQGKSTTGKGGKDAQPGPGAQ